MNTDKIMENIDKGIENGLKRAAAKSKLNDGVMWEGKNERGEVIRRPATDEEVLKVAHKIIDKLKWFYDNNYYHDYPALEVNCGQLVVEETT